MNLFTPVQHDLFTAPVPEPATRELFPKTNNMQTLIKPTEIVGTVPSTIRIPDGRDAQDVFTPYYKLPNGYAHHALRELETVTISIKVGKKITVYYQGETVYLIRANGGSNSWSSVDAWRKPDGTFREPYNGSQKVNAAICALARRITATGLAEALKHYARCNMCCMCGADLTDPVSKLRGIGPECIKKVDAMRLMQRIWGS